MSGRLDYDRLKRRDRGRHGEPLDRPEHPRTGQWKGFRAAWDGEPFPVTISHRPAEDGQTNLDQAPEEAA